jgi:hypothetical protein
MTEFIEAQPAVRPPVRRWRILLLLVPALCLATALFLRPAGRLGPPSNAEWIDQLVYDDYDFGAYALRGLNHFLGRHAGRREAPKRLFEDYAAAMREPRPLADSYYLEYPHAALMLFYLPYWFSSDDLQAPASVLDGAHEDLVEHVPDGEEAVLWEHLHRIVTSYMFIMLASYLALVVVLSTGYLADGGLAYCGLLLILPGALFFSLNRFDIVPALLTALSLACLGRNRTMLSALFMAAGTLVKVYPILLAPLVVRYLLSARGRRDATEWSLMYGGAMFAFIGPAMLTWGTTEVVAPYIVQLSREHEGLTAYIYLIPNSLKGLREELSGTGPVGRGFRLGVLAIVMGLMLIKPMPRFSDVLRRGTVVLVAFIAVSVFYSPQWLVWLMPLLLPLTGTNRRLIALIVALDLLTWGQWPLACNLARIFDMDDYPRDVVLTLLAWPRFAVLGMIVWSVFRPERSPEAVHPVVGPALS